MLKLVFWCLYCIFTFSLTCSRPLKSCYARMKTTRGKNLGAYRGISCRRTKWEGKRWQIARIWEKTNEQRTFLRFHLVAKGCNHRQERTNEWSVLFNRNHGCGAEGKKLPRTSVSISNLKRIGTFQVCIFKRTVHILYIFRFCKCGSC